ECAVHRWRDGKRRAVRADHGDGVLVRALAAAAAVAAFGLVQGRLQLTLVDDEHSTWHRDRAPRDRRVRCDEAGAAADAAEPAKILALYGRRHDTARDLALRVEGEQLGGAEPRDVQRAVRHDDVA